MAEMIKEIKTRVALRTGDYAYWTTGAGKDIELYKGEVCICTVAVADNQATTAPTVLFKVADANGKKFADLDWCSAKAADVYAWAKKSEEEFVTWVNTVVEHPANPVIATGSTNGTISVDGTDVAVKGLGSAAYTDSDIYVKEEGFENKVHGAVNTYKMFEQATGLDHTIKEAFNDIILGDIKAGDALYANEARKTSKTVTFVLPSQDLKFNGSQDVTVDIGLEMDQKLGNYYNKNEADATFATPEEVITEVNKALADVSSSDTITNITTLVEYVNNNAGDLTSLITEVYGSAEMTGDSRIDTAVSDAANAVSKANTALTNANLAKDDAEEAVRIADEAKEAATNATTGAAASAAAASASESAARASEAKAGEYETFAHEWALVASQARDAADTAQSKAEDAQAYAEAAQADAEAAKADAEKAKTDAESASLTAQEESAAAIEAKAGAETAQTKAEAAQGKAEAAQGAAETAKAGAETAENNARASELAAATAQKAAEDARDAAVNANTSATAIANEAKGLAESAVSSANNAVSVAGTALQTIEVGTGLKVSTKKDNKQKIEIDDDVIFVLNANF